MHLDLAGPQAVNRAHRASRAIPPARANLPRKARKVRKEAALPAAPAVRRANRVIPPTRAATPKSRAAALIQAVKVLTPAPLKAKPRSQTNRLRLTGKSGRSGA